MKRPYITTQYKDLSRFEKCELIILKGWKEQFEIEPEKVMFVKDYPETILIELFFSRSGASYKKMLPKSAMAVGDYIIKDKEFGTVLTGEEVTKFNMNVKPIKFEGVKIWE